MQDTWLALDLIPGILWAARLVKTVMYTERTVAPEPAVMLVRQGQLVSECVSKELVPSNSVLSGI